MPITRTVRGAHDITDWDPEDVAAWDAGGAKVARRNLIWSIVAEHVGFGVVDLVGDGVVHAAGRVSHRRSGEVRPRRRANRRRCGSSHSVRPAVTRFGGRNWTIFSALVLLVPAALTLYFMAHPETSYTTFVLVSAFAGLGGGNFASSMANINAFYPQRLKGWALGLNAAAATSESPPSN